MSKIGIRTKMQVNLHLESMYKINSFEKFKRGIPKFYKERIILAGQDEGLLTNGLKKIFELTRQLQMQVLS